MGILGALGAGLGLQGNTSMRGDQTIGPAGAFREGDIISVTTSTPPGREGVASSNMSAADPEWPELLRGYEAAIAEFESVSRALTTALMERNAGDNDLRALVLEEERARETVVLARMRLINLWRESGVEIGHGIGFRGDEIAADAQ
jgi:hypothetical protein